MRKSEETTPLRVLFADDSILYREEEGKLLSRFPDVELVAIAASGAEALRLAQTVEWDVALLDIAMPDLDGIEVLKVLIEQRPTATVVMLTAFERPQTLREALAAGAKGFLTKETPADEIVAGLRRAYCGKTVLDDRPTDLLRDFYVHGAEDPADDEFVARLEQLPERLHKIAKYLAKSYTNREIARATGLSEQTVGSYVRDTITRLGARRGEIAVKMSRLGLDS